MIKQPMFGNFSIPEYRYEHDRAFKNLVDLLHHFIQRAEFTPSEVREAALLACIHHEVFQVRKYYLDPDQFNMTERIKEPGT